MASAVPARFREALAARSIALDRELGRGGMSVVYLARDLRHDRLVAVKVLRPDVPGGAERFLREIKLVAALISPHIVPLYDSSAVHGTPFFVKPYVEGMALRQRLQREERLDVDEALRLATEIGEALEFAHQRGVLHRDIKPENILLGFPLNVDDAAVSAHALVADFAVARALAADYITASLAGRRRFEVVTSAPIIPSRLSTGLQIHTPDDPARLHQLAEETAAGTLVSGSFFRADGRISFQAEITNADDGTPLAAVGPESAPRSHVDIAVDSLERGVVDAVGRTVRPRG